MSGREYVGLDVGEVRYTRHETTHRIDDQTWGKAEDATAEVAALRAELAAERERAERAEESIEVLRGIVRDEALAKGHLRAERDALADALRAWKRWAREAEQRKVTQPLWASLLLDEAHRLTAAVLSGVPTNERVPTVRKCSTECWQTGHCDGTCDEPAPTNERETEPTCNLHGAAFTNGCPGCEAAEEKSLAAFRASAAAQMHERLLAKEASSVVRERDTQTDGSET